MFTKLKNKIAEEVKQSPLKLSASVQQLAQAVVSPSNSSSVESTPNDHFSIGDAGEETPQNSPSKSGGFQSVDLYGDSPLSPPAPSAGGRSRHSSTSSVTSDASSLFPIFESSVLNSFSLQSDLESASEVEDSLGHQLDRISKEQLYAAYRKLQARYTKYKGRYVDLARHYRELDRENVKAKTVLVESQDKALRRIAELKEQCQLEQKAKAHLEDALRNDLEEKDHLISTLNTKIELLKLNGGKEEDDPSSQKVDYSENLLIDLSGGELAIPVQIKQLQEEQASVNETDTVLKEKIWKLETLLRKCKESIRRNKERISQLRLENQQLQQTLTDTKESSSAQVSTLTENLTTAQQEIGKLMEALNTLHKREEEAALSLAENKMTIHRELEAKEEQIRSLRDSLTQITRDKEALDERATSLQNEMTRLKSVAAVPAAEDIGSSEEDRQNLIQELSRGKAEAVKLLQQEMQQKLIDLETKMSDKLQASELTNIQLEAEVKLLKQQIEEQDQANKELELKLKSLQDVRSPSGKTHINSEGNFELEVVMKEFKNKLQVAETKLAEKENMIAELEASYKLLSDEHNKELLSLKSKVEVASANRLQTESKLTKKDQEIKELKRIHKEQLEDGQKALTEMQSQLRLESARKNEAENKYIELLNQIGSVSSQNKDAELMSFEIASLKEKARDLELKLSEAAEECRKVEREKENLGSVLVGSFKDVALLKQSLQALRTDVYDRLNCGKEDVNRLGSQVMDIFDLTKREVETVRRELQERDNIHINLRKELSILEKELSEQETNIKCKRKLERMLEDLRLSKKNLETELSENNALITKLQHELQNMTTTLERKEQETCELCDNITGLQKELTEKMERANEDLVNLRSDYEVKLQSKDTEISELKNTHDECCIKVISLESDLNITESKLKTVSEDYKNLKLENEKQDSKVKELEDHCHSLTTDVVVLIEERERLAGTVDELTCALTGYKRENNVLNEKIKRLTDSLTDANNETAALRAEIEKLSVVLMKANKEKQVLESQNSEIKDAKLEVIENFKSQEVVWNSKSNSDEVKIKNLEAALQSLQRELKYEKQQFEYEISNLSSQLEQSQQKEGVLSAEAEMLKKENIKVKGDYSSLKSELEQTQQRVQLLSAEIEHINIESTNQGHLLKEKEAELKIMAAEKEAILAKSSIESAKILEAETKLNTLNEEREKWLKQQALLEIKEKDLKQLNIKLEEQLHIESQETTMLKDECKSMKESNDLLTKQVEQLISIVDSLKKTSKENYELIEQLKAEKSALENTININVTQEKELRDAVHSLQSEVSHLKSQNEILTSEREVKTQQLNKLERELEESIFERSTIKETRLDLEKVLIEKSNLEEQLENLLDEKKLLEDQLNCEENVRKEKHEEERLEVEKVYMKNKELQKQLDSALKEKLDLEQTLTTRCGNLEGLQMETMPEQKRNLSDICELRRQLEDTLLEKTALECKLSTEIEKARGMQDLEKLLAEKEQLEHQLDNTLVDLQEKEKQVAELEDIHAQKIKQLVHDFEKQLVQRNEELTNLEDKKFERREQEENMQVREYQDHIKELCEASEAQGEAFQQLYVQHEEALKMKDAELNNSELHIQELQAAHQQELAEVDKRWHQCLEQQLMEAKARHKEEMAELNKEWHWERKELENTSHMAVAAVESGTGSVELLHRQLMAQTNELKEVKRLHRLEVNELRRLLSLRRTLNSSGKTPEATTLEDACTELEYLRNILYEYMMGKEPVVLARVIAAVVKFDTEQTSRILQKEEQKQTLHHFGHQKHHMDFPGIAPSLQQ